MSLRGKRPAGLKLGETLLFYYLPFPLIVFDYICENLCSSVVKIAFAVLCASVSQAKRVVNCC
jgi:hypothetical protein